jgi:cell wall-associated NlpC family hydrolase
MKFDNKKSEAIAQELLGMEFEIQCRGEDKKIDCYGVLIYYYRQFGIELPDYMYQQDWGDNADLVLREYAKWFRKLGPDEKPATGDMIIIVNHHKSASHLGVCLPRKRFVHSYMGIGSKIDKWINPPWNEPGKIYGFFRIKEQ